MKHVHRFFAVLIVLPMLILGRGATAFAESILTMPADLKIIEARAFYGDTSIDQVVLQEGVVEIRAKAFANSSLTSINLPDTLTFIADDAFQGSALEYVTADENTYAYRWAVDHGYIEGDILLPVQCFAERVVFKEPTQAQINAVAVEWDILEAQEPAEYFGIEEIKIGEVFGFDAIDADVGPDVIIFDDGKIEITVLTGLPFAPGDRMLVLLGVYDENSDITWTPYEGLVGNSNDTLVRVDPAILDNASFIAVVD